MAWTGVVRDMVGIVICEIWFFICRRLFEEIRAFATLRNFGSDVQLTPVLPDD
jgi:hypothetical protein